MRWNLSIPLAAAMLASLGLAACEPQGPVAAPRPPQPVAVMTVTPAPETAAWSYVGVVRPRVLADLGFRVGGKVIERFVDVGDRVAAGQPIARLDDVDLRLALEAQRAENAAARVALAEAEASEGRYRTLHDAGHVARAALDHRISAAAEAASRLERASRNVALAENQLGYAVLTAKDAGTVTALPVEVGQVVLAGQTVARVARLDDVEVEVAVPEHMVAALERSRAEIEVWSSGERKPARLRELSPDADTTSRTFRARFAFEPDQTVSLGRTATVHLVADHARVLVRVPSTAVANDGRGPHVFVVTENGTRVVAKPVAVHAYLRDDVLIREGLSAGERIVTVGLHVLDPARPVRVVEQRASLR